MILNLKKFNNYIDKHKFKMETLNSMLDMVQQNSWMTSVDLSDAYLVIPLLCKHSGYLKFIWRNIVYKYIVMAFGLTSAPRKFTKLLKVLLSWLCRLGHLVSMYLDDSLQVGVTFDECLYSTQVTYNFLISAGFIPNEKKSQLVPSQVITILGFVINSVTMTISLPDSKTKCMLDLISAALDNPTMSIRQLAWLIGKLISCFPALPYGRLYYRALEHCKNYSLGTNRYNFEVYMTLDPASLWCLSWWHKNIPDAVAPIRLQTNPSEIIFMDVSSYAWGCYYNGKIAQGYFSPLEFPLSINSKETLAIWYGLHSFRHQFVRFTHVDTK